MPEVGDDAAARAGRDAGVVACAAIRDAGTDERLNTKARNVRSSFIASSLLVDEAVHAGCTVGYGRRLGNARGINAASDGTERRKRRQPPCGDCLLSRSSRGTTQSILVTFSAAGPFWPCTMS